MHIGVRITPAMDPSVAGLARKAEDMGFDSVWLSERVAVPLDQEHAYDPSIDPWVGLAYVAAVTSRVKLGTCVSQIALRHPVIMARILATLDRLSAGRVIVGAGAGWVGAEFAVTGVDYETRGGRLAEHIQAMRHLWTDPKTPWEGKHFQIPGAEMLLPATPGGPPIFIGASNARGLQRAALYGDGYLSVGLGPASLAGVLEGVRARYAEAGRTGHLPVFCQVFPPESPDAARELVTSHRDAGADGLILAEPLGKGDGFPRDDAISRALLETAAD